MRLLSQSVRSNLRTATLLAAITALLLAMVAPFVGTAGADHEDYICHRNRSTQSPYVVNSPDGSGTDGRSNDDHSSHVGPLFDPEFDYERPLAEDAWGDIIPHVLNWTPEGQAIWENNCQVPDPQPDPEADLTVIKNVVNNNGGTAEAGDFDLFIGQDEVTSGQAQTLTPDTYTVSETIPGDLADDYTADGIECFDSQDVVAGDPGDTDPLDSTSSTSLAVELTDGDDITCIVTNDDNPQQQPPPPTPGNWDLTVDKSVLDSRTNPQTETFEFAVDCGADYSTTLTIVGEDTATAANIPDGADCTVAETVDADADTTSVGLTEGELDPQSSIDLEARSADVTVFFENTFSEVLAEVVDPDASVTADCGGAVVDLDNTASTVAVDFVITVNGDDQTVTVPAGGVEQVSAPLTADDRWSALVQVDENVLADEGGQEDCTVPPTIAPTSSITASCEDGVTVTLDNGGSDVAVTYTINVNGETRDVPVTSGETRTFDGDLDDDDAYDVTVTAEGMDPVTAQDDLDCAQVRGVVIEQDEELAATGADHVRTLGLAVMISVLGAVMLLATSDGRRKRSTS